MNKQELVRAFAIATVALLGLLLSTSIVLAGAVPKADCGRGDRTESGLQGQTTTEERFSGDSELGYNCNLELVGQQPQGAFEGAFSQNGPAYFGDCAYYGTDRVTPLQQHLGVTVIDASDPRHPRVSAYLDDTPAALAPHETLQTNERSQLLVVAENNGPNFAVYDISADCRHPVLKSSIDLPGSVGHQGAFSPDGRTYWVTQTGGEPRQFLYSVDLTDPSNPLMLPTWQFEPGAGRLHEVQFNPKGFAPGVPEGTRVYGGQNGGNSGPGGSIGPNGLVIVDVSDYQFRLPNPELRIISTLFWDGSGAEPMVPVKIKGHPYIVSSDESTPVGGLAACARGASAFGYPRIIDVGDETNPKIIAELQLEVSDPANCSLLLNEPPDPAGIALGYNEERCVADNPNNATMLACSFQNAGLRVFDIRDLYRPKEIAYWKPPAVRTEVQPSSGSWAEGADRTVDRIAGWARWVVVDEGKGHHDKAKHKGRELQLWTVSDGNGFQVLRFTDHFKAQYKDLFRDAGK